MRMGGAPWDTTPSSVEEDGFADRQGGPICSMGHRALCCHGISGRWDCRLVLGGSLFGILASRALVVLERYGG